MSDAPATERRLGAEGYVLLGVLLLAGLAAVLYAKPPLRNGGGSGMSTPAGTVVSVGLVNEGLWTAVLTDVEFSAGQAPAVVAVDNRGGEQASSVAARLAGVPDAASGPVRGWGIKPIGRLTEFPRSGESAALRLSWPPGVVRPQTMTVRYRYLGLPMTLDVSLAERTRLLP